MRPSRHVRLRDLDWHRDQYFGPETGLVSRLSHLCDAHDDNTIACQLQLHSEIYWLDGHHLRLTPAASRYAITPEIADTSGHLVISTRRLVVVHFTRKQTAIDRRQTDCVAILANFYPKPIPIISQSLCCWSVLQVGPLSVDSSVLKQLHTDNRRQSVSNIHNGVGHDSFCVSDAFTYYDRPNISSASSWHGAKLIRGGLWPWFMTVIFNPGRTMVLAHARAKIRVKYPQVRLNARMETDRRTEYVNDRSH